MAYDPLDDCIIIWQTLLSNAYVVKINLKSKLVVWDVALSNCGGYCVGMDVDSKGMIYASSRNIIYVLRQDGSKLKCLIKKNKPWIVQMCMDTQENLVVVLEKRVEIMSRQGKLLKTYPMLDYSPLYQLFCARESSNFFMVGFNSIRLYDKDFAIIKENTNVPNNGAACAQGGRLFVVDCSRISILI